MRDLPSARSRGHAFWVVIGFFGAAVAGRWQFGIRNKFLLLSVSFLLAVVLPSVARGDCSLTATGNVPLPDLGGALYLGFTGGLYPGGSNIAPASHTDPGFAIAVNQIRPLSSTGTVDDAHGTIGFISIGDYDTTQAFANSANSFKTVADADPSKNPHLTIVDGSQSGKDAAAWSNPSDSAWTTLAQRLSTAGVSSSQVEVVWMQQGLEYPAADGGFPAAAQKLQADIEAILRTVKALYPNAQIVYLSSRSRSYTNDPSTLSPEPSAYESGFAVQWAIADQIDVKGNINFNPGNGPVVAPYITWGPYLWADGTTPRSDGFTWLCSDVDPSDFTHLSASGIGKVADQLLAFFKTDSTAPWFLNRKLTMPPSVTVTAIPTGGLPGFSTRFTAKPGAGASIASYSWTFDDGTFSDSQDPKKTFPVAGDYSVRVTATASTGDNVTATIPITVGAAFTSLVNVSTRLQVGLGESVGINGFIVTGTAGTKKVILRAIGPSLAAQGVAGVLGNPFLELHDSTGAMIASNDDWETTIVGGVITADQSSVIYATGLAPTDSMESAMVVDLLPGAYTAVIYGVNGETGVGLADIYDLDPASPATVANLSTRGMVGTDANVLIGGFIVGGTESSNALVRAIGPSLVLVGLSNTLSDPTLELYDANGVLIGINDNWGDTQMAEIQATGLAPLDPYESVIDRSFLPGAYTAIVAGKDGTSGIALVEIYKLP
ncbi:MAG: PKD domain-containing protein [Chthoniobacterales bacterium]